MIGVVVCISVMWALLLLTPFWWWVMIVPFVYALVRGKSAAAAFRAGMASAGLVWLLGGTYAWLHGSEIIVGRVAKMMHLGTPLAVLALTAVVAAVAGGLAASAGARVRAAFRP